VVKLKYGEAGLIWIAGSGLNWTVSPFILLRCILLFHLNGNALEHSRGGIRVSHLMCNDMILSLSFVVLVFELPPRRGLESLDCLDTGMVQRVAESLRKRDRLQD
jgi:hypothetical protein